MNEYSEKLNWWGRNIDKYSDTLTCDCLDRLITRLSLSLSFCISEEREREVVWSFRQIELFLKAVWLSNMKSDSTWSPPTRQGLEREKLAGLQMKVQTRVGSFHWFVFKREVVVGKRKGSREGSSREGKTQCKKNPDGCCSNWRNGKWAM